MLVVGVRFRRAGKIYYFDPGTSPAEAEALFRPGTGVIIETIRGIEFGKVAVPPREVGGEDVVQPLKKVLRLASPEDLAIVALNQQDAERALPLCAERIRAHRLPMKLVDAEYTFDRAKLIFYFTAEGRVDFRALVRDLASIFRTRIELRQIGVRDEAKMRGGLGPCGLPVCCATWLAEFQPITIKMAKDQSLVLNPSKISGLCGRLMCCLRYEHEQYEATRETLPIVGEEILTPLGEGEVVEVGAEGRTVVARLRDGRMQVFSWDSLLEFWNSQLQ
ncbi:cell fate regulator YaaT (PSP1 superfamily) [Brockia lithotrophica]|uniref:Cell fate regulator YaaT (PSP1 superfamily) n=1 Tax=Brockia lithotrophica TaxID=933949 RepID=A0A660KWC5_9BACL|nr:cell fate regulator YaaT (PSP1 superfamily) [Brockia lithotrophica]